MLILSVDASGINSLFKGRDRKVSLLSLSTKLCVKINRIP